MFITKDFKSAERVALETDKTIWKAPDGYFAVATAEDLVDAAGYEAASVNVHKSAYEIADQWTEIDKPICPNCGSSVNYNYHIKEIEMPRYYRNEREYEEFLAGNLEMLYGHDPRPESQPIRVVLSSPILLEDGTFKRETITLEEAQEWVDVHEPTIFSGHETVRVIGLEPAKERRTCERFDEALVLQPKERLEYGREYMVDEIEEIGVTPILVTKVA